MTDDGKHFARRLRAFGILPLHRHTGRDKFCKFSSPFIYETIHSVFADMCLDGPRRVPAQWRNSARATIIIIIIII